MSFDRNDETSSNPSEEPHPAFETLDVVGKRRNPLGLILLGIVIGVLLLLVIQGKGGLALYVFLAMLIPNFATSLTLFFRPPRMMIADGEFSLRLLPTFRTPAANVANIQLTGGKVQISFHDAEQVEPEQHRQPLTKQYQKQGYHLETLPGVFSLQQVNELRRGLGHAIQQQDRFASFHTQLQQLTPRVVVTPMIIAANTLIFLLMAAQGVGIATTDLNAIIAWGANYGPLTSDGEWWRLLTSMFLHFGVLHLMFNMWVLRDVGALVERLVGNTGFALAYLICGFFGSVASLYWNDAVVSAGASGAIFGVFGILLGFMVFQKDSVPPQIAKERKSSAIAFLLFNVMIGLSIPWIDQAAHIGGFAAGFLCGAALSCDLSRAVAARRIRNLALGLAGAAAAAITITQLPPRDHAAFYFGSQIDAVDESAVRIYEETAQQLASSQASPRQAAQAMRASILPLYESVAEQIQQASTGGPQQRLRFTLSEYVRLRREGWELLADAVEREDIVHEGMAIEKFELAHQLLMELNPDIKAMQDESATDLRTEIARVSLCEFRASEKYAALMSQWSAGQIPAGTLADDIEQQVLALWDQGRDRWMTARETLPVEDQQSTAELTAYLTLQRDAWSLQVQALRNGDDETAALAAVKLAEANAMSAKMWQATGE